MLVPSSRIVYHDPISVYGSLSSNLVVLAGLAKTVLIAPGLSVTGTPLRLYSFTPEACECDC